METAAGIHDDWELLVAPDSSSGDDLEPSETAETAAESAGADDGVIKTDYFALDSYRLHPEAAAFDSGSYEDEEVQVNPDGPVLLDPGTDAGYLSGPDGLLDGQKPRLGSGRGFRSDGQSSGLGSEEEEEELGEVARGDAGDENHSSGQISRSCESPNLASGIGDKSICPPGEAGSAVAWWKLPFQMLKFCAFRVKPIWSISVAAAMLGVWVLGKRLSWIKQKRRSIPLKLNLDEKKTSQLKVHAARLNASFSIVRRARMIRAQLPASGLPLPVMGFQ